MLQTNLSQLDTQTPFIFLSDLPVPILMTDGYGYVTWLNDAFSALCGYTLSEMKGEKPGRLLQGLFTDKETAKRIGNAIREMVPIEEVLLNYAKSKTPYWVRLQIFPVKNANDECKGFVSFATDVTLQIESQREEIRKRAKEARMKLPEGLVFKCSWTNQLRIDEDNYVDIEEWFARQSEVRLSHGISPAALKRQREVLNEQRNTSPPLPPRQE